MIHDMLRGSMPRALVLGSAVLLSACGDDAPTTGPSAPPPGDLQQMAPARSPDPLLAYARAIPGFGGLFMGKDGVPTVYLTDLRQRGTAERVLANELRRLGPASSQLRVIQGDYDYLQLDRWFTRAMPEALAIPGAVFVDVDEGSNRLRIGVETPAADAAVRGKLGQLAVPAAAVVVERAEPFRFAATLRQNRSPERGGLQITLNGGAICTLGFNTRFSSGIILRRSFITNSHCTNVQGGVEGTEYHQPLISGTTSRIGTEVADPAYWTLFPCPSGRRCRFSDAARALYRFGAGVDHGGIARTTGVGSITIDAADPVFNITAEVPKPVQFNLVNKVGRTTGWTAGIVTSTCAGINVSGTNITLVCQDRVLARVAAGDSGSPVFSWAGGQTVGLYGILWGGNSSGTEFVFSRMSNIEFELGSLTTF